jgi:ribosomal protein S27AE
MKDRSYLARGICQKCRAKEVIAHSGYKHLCGRCANKLFVEISESQKKNWMKTGRVSE